MVSRAADYQTGQAIPGTVYRVHKVLGSGGMGTVYDVEDTTVGKRYVLKTLHGDLADRPDLADRLGREARALAKLQHPNIVEVFTSGTTQDSLHLPYYVMERLHGESLREVIAQKKQLSVEQACDIGIDLLSALDHAHEYGIIHRDVKPDNIFVTRSRDGRPLAKLLDFGIIKLVTGPGASTVQQTGGRFIGTFRYAPPEQILGREVGARSDLYAAGLVIYEMIAGRGPFDDFTGEMEIGKAHIHVVPPPLSRFAQVHPAVEQLVMSALQKDQAQRPRDAFTFASALSELKKQFGAVPPPPSHTANTVQRTVVPSSAARPAVLFGEATPADVGPATGVATRIDAPAGMNATTAMAASGRVTHTVSLGVLPHAQAAPQTTFAAAPLTAAVAEAPLIVDRRAETREAIPQPTPQPSYDTAPIPLAVLAPRPNETLGPHTTEESLRKKSGRHALMMIAGITATVAVVGVAVVGRMWRQQKPATEAVHQTTAAEIVAPPIVAPTASAPSAIAVSLAVESAVTVVEPPPKLAAPLPTHTSNVTVQATRTPTVATTSSPPPSATATHRRPGSGL